MKKKLFLLTVAMILAFQPIAQKRTDLSRELFQTSVKRTFTPALTGEPVPVEMNTPFTKSVFYSLSDPWNHIFEEEQIGTTWWDLQTNALTQNRLYLFDDGTISAVWTYGDPVNNFQILGTGYNYFDGNNWGAYPTATLENQRTGWPCVTAWGTEGEIICAHLTGPVNYGLLFNRRPVKGIGPWEEIYFAGPAGSPKIFWPRMITSGPENQTVYLLVLTAPVSNGGSNYQGQDGALLYNRSQDGGNTWDIHHQVIEGLDSSYYNAIHADNYMWAGARAGVVAFMIADPWMDLVLMKSSDNGDSWDKTVVWKHPYPFFEWSTTITTDTIWCPDNSGGMAIDLNGMVHIVFGISRVAHFAIGNTFEFWPFTDGIAYWNESMPPFEAPDPHDALCIHNLVQDYNLIGWSPYFDPDSTINLLNLVSYNEMGMSTMPDIIIDDCNRIYLMFSSTTNILSAGSYYLKHILLRHSEDCGNTWHDFFDIGSEMIHIFDEMIYPHASCSCYSDEWFYFYYIFDQMPGLACAGNHPFVENSVVHCKNKIFLEDIIEQEPPSGLEVSQNVPNPFTRESFVRITLQQRAQVRITLHTIEGKQVVETRYGMLNPGIHRLRMDGSGLNPGLYFYTVKADEQAVTNRMIIR